MAAVITLLCTCSDDYVKVDPIWGASGVPKPHGSSCTSTSIRTLASTTSPCPPSCKACFPGPQIPWGFSADIAANARCFYTGLEY